MGQPATARGKQQSTQYVSYEVEVDDVDSMTLRGTPISSKTSYQKLAMNIPCARNVSFVPTCGSILPRIHLLHNAGFHHITTKPGAPTAGMSQSLGVISPPHIECVMSRIGQATGRCTPHISPVVNLFGLGAS